MTSRVAPMRVRITRRSLCGGGCKKARAHAGADDPALADRRKELAASRSRGRR